MLSLLRYLAFAIIALVGLDFAVILLTPVFSEPRRSDFAIVLGNTVLSDGTPSPRLKARLDCALVLYRSHVVKRIVVSGGYEWNINKDESESMRRYLILQGVPNGAIVQDAFGDNTLSTARNARVALPAGSSVVAVSQWFHIARSEVALRRCGFAEVSGISPRLFEWRDLYSLAREAVALPWYAMRPLPALKEPRR